MTNGSLFRDHFGIIVYVCISVCFACILKTPLTAGAVARCAAIEGSTETWAASTHHYSSGCLLSVMTLAICANTRLGGSILIARVVSAVFESFTDSVAPATNAATAFGDAATAFGAAFGGRVFFSQSRTPLDISNKW